MRTAMSSLVLSVLALGLAGEARAGVLSDLVGSIPMPSFSLQCLEPGDQDTPSGAGAPAPRERRESLPAHGAPATIDGERPRADDASPGTGTIDAGSDKAPRARPTRWKALLPGALK